MARRRKRGRPINGVLLLDKGAGITSNGVLQKVRGVYNAQKAGHTGTLDPFATGLLPICFGEATKFSRYLTDAFKAYTAHVQLGVTTTTGDVDGEVLVRQPIPADLSLDTLLSHAYAFEGTTQQIPPMHSALKQNGVPLYELARQGITVEREARAITITEQSMSAVDLTTGTFDWFIRCSKGTYIRSVVEDLGQALGCGAHTVALRRESVGPFQLSDAVTFDVLQALRDQDNFDELDQFLLPMDVLFEGWDRVCVSQDESRKLRLGQSIACEGNWPVEHEVCVLESDQTVIGVAVVTDDRQLQPRRLVVT